MSSTLSIRPSKLPRSVMTSRVEYVWNCHINICRKSLISKIAHYHSRYPLTYLILLVVSLKHCWMSAEGLPCVATPVNLENDKNELKIDDKLTMKAIKKVETWIWWFLNIIKKLLGTKGNSSLIRRSYRSMITRFSIKSKPDRWIFGVYFELYFILNG